LKITPLIFKTWRKPEQLEKGKKEEKMKIPKNLIINYVHPESIQSNFDSAGLWRFYLY
jgi:hypothetical protein